MIRSDIKSISKNEIKIEVRVWCLHALRFNIGGNHLRRKTANQSLVQVVKRNKDGPLLSTTFL